MNILNDLPLAARDAAMAEMREQHIRRGLCPECGHVHHDQRGGYACEGCPCPARWFWVTKYGRTSTGDDFK